MMFVETSAGNLKVAFFHQTQAKMDGDFLDRFTTCNIYQSNSREDKDGPLVAEGFAWCHPRDNFNKSEGRKIALNRAMENLELSRDVRGEVWTEYFKNHKK